MRPSRDDLTPFLDFLLLTLIALLAITAQRLDVETIPIDEPEVAGGTDSETPLGEAMVVELDADGRHFLDGRRVELDRLVDELRSDRRVVLLRADRRASTGASLDTLSRLREVAEDVVMQVEEKRKERDR
jgi:biopolymer transport protein ExbD